MGMETGLNLLLNGKRSWFRSKNSESRQERTGQGFALPREIPGEREDKVVMAVVRKIEPVILDRDSKHTEVDCTYTIISDVDGKKYLQIDTYGSVKRKIPRNKSQSIRFSPEAIDQLTVILNAEFL
jgi:hypothetical protein